MEYGFRIAIPYLSHQADSVGQLILYDPTSLRTQVRLVEETFSDCASR